jgi:copper chaperone CopZ
MAMQARTDKQVLCPACGNTGKAVGSTTLRALLKEEFRDRVAGEARCCSDPEPGVCRPVAAEAGWRFCGSPDCDVVYCAEEGGTTFVKSQLRVPVGVKERVGERPLCYCFGHSVASIKEELRTKGRSDSLEDIRQKMKGQGCSCEVTNPSGSCCLGSVARGVETARSELSGTTPGSKAETISKVGMVLSAVMASACCWLPLLLLAFGVSGAGIAGALDAYRPLFIALTAVFLAAAFYFTYRPRKAASASEDCCAPAHDCCAAPGPTGTRRFNMMTLNKVTLWVVTVLAVAFLFFPSYMKFFLTGARSGEIAANDAAVRTTAYSVEGMTCEGCSALVGKAIQEVPGVLSVRVDYDRQRAVVSTEACCPDPTEAVLRALEKAGYQGEVVVNDPPPSP